MKFFRNKNIKFHKIYENRQEQPVRYERLFFCAIIFLYTIIEAYHAIHVLSDDKVITDQERRDRKIFKIVYYAVFNIIIFAYFTTRKNGQHKANQILEIIVVFYLGAGALYDYVTSLQEVNNAKNGNQLQKRLLRSFVMTTSGSLLWFILIMTFVRRMYNVVIYIFLDLTGFVALLFSANRELAAIKTIIATCFLLLLLGFIHKKKLQSFSELWKLKASDKFYKNVLNFLPESIMSFSQEGHVTYNNNYLEKMFLCDVKNGLNSTFYANFSCIKLRDCIEDINFHHLPAAGTIKAQIPNSNSLIGNQEDIFKLRAQEIQTLPNLVDFFKENAETWKKLNSYVLVFDSKFTHPLNQIKHSIEIKAFILDDEGEAQLTLIFRDTTDRDTIAALESENQTYKNNVIASFSHELRTPLNSNLGSLEQSMNRPDVPQDVKENLLEPALISAKLLLHLVNDTLDYSQILNQSFQLNIKSFSLVQTLKKCAALFEKRIVAKGLNFIMDIAPEDEGAIICTDHQRLSQILTNLLSNALKFTFKGKIQIELKKNKSKEYQLNISDTGIGMDDDVQAKLMKNLEAGRALESKISSNSTGIGIGLTMASTLCQLLSPEANQGLRFYSTKDQGSTFYMTIRNFLSSSSSSIEDHEIDEILPKKNHVKVQKTISPLISETSEHDDMTNDFKDNNNLVRQRTMTFKNKLLEPKTQQLIPSTSGSSPSIVNPASILIVDDEVFNLMILENYCKSAQLRTERAYNGKEALQKVQDIYGKGQRFDMVLMDVNMPIMDGYQTTVNLRNLIASHEIPNDVIIIGVTAYVSKDKIDKCYECGMNEVVNKPLSQNDFTLLMKKYKIIEP